VEGTLLYLFVRETLCLVAILASACKGTVPSRLCMFMQKSPFVLVFLFLRNGKEMITKVMAHEPQIIDIVLKVTDQLIQRMAQIFAQTAFALVVNQEGLSLTILVSWLTSTATLLKLIADVVIISMRERTSRAKLMQIEGALGRENWRRSSKSVVSNEGSRSLTDNPSMPSQLVNIRRLLFTQSNVDRRNSSVLADILNPTESVSVRRQSIKADQLLGRAGECEEDGELLNQINELFGPAEDSTTLAARVRRKLKSLDLRLLTALNEKQPATLTRLAAHNVEKLQISMKSLSETQKLKAIQAQARVKLNRAKSMRSRFNGPADADVDSKLAEPSSSSKVAEPSSSSLVEKILLGADPAAVEMSTNKTTEILLEMTRQLEATDPQCLSVAAGRGTKDIYGSEETKDGSGLLGDIAIQVPVLEQTSEKADAGVKVPSGTPIATTGRASRPSAISAFPPAQTESCRGSICEDLHVNHVINELLQDLYSDDDSDDEGKAFVQTHELVFAHEESTFCCGPGSRK